MRRRGPPLLPLATGTGALTALLLTGCDPGGPAAGANRTATAQAAAYDPEWRATADRKRPKVRQIDAGPSPSAAVRGRPTPPIRPSPDDPLGGRFTMADALAGLDGNGRPLATIETSVGDLQCDLWPERAPLAVANFIGLARGLRPWKSPDGRWVRRPAYDGTTFHRVVPGFAIQGGSPNGRADFRPGYGLPDEIWNGANHDRAGLLCMVTTGPHTGAMQFFVTDGPAPQLDGSYTIFGACRPVERIHAIARAKAHRGRPLRPVTIDAVRIERRAEAGRADGAHRSEPAALTPDAGPKG